MIPPSWRAFWMPNDLAAGAACMLCVPFEKLQSRTSLAFQTPHDRRRGNRIGRGVAFAVAGGRELRASAKDVAGRAIERAVAGGANDVAAYHAAVWPDRQLCLGSAFGAGRLR